VGSGRGGGRGLWDPVRQIIAGTGQECEAPKLFWLKGKREGRDSRRGEGEGSWEERLEGRRVGAMDRCVGWCKRHVDAHIGCFGGPKHVKDFGDFRHAHLSCIKY